jgi:hypothetical protein
MSVTVNQRYVRSAIAVMLVIVGSKLLLSV